MSKKVPKDKKAKLRRNLLIVAAVLLVAAAVIGGLANVLTEYWWFEHLGFDRVFLTVILSRAAIGVAFGVTALAWFLLHIHLIRKCSSPRKDWTIPTAEGDIDVQKLVRKVATPVVVLGAVAAATAMGVWASQHWEDVLKYINRTAFGHSEPILNQDVSFYLFQLPAMEFAQEWLLYLTGLSGVLSAVVYGFRGALEIDGRWPQMSRQVRGHLLFAVATVLLVIGWGFRLEMFESLFSKRGVAYGATYAEVYANLPAFRVLIAVCVVAAIFLLYQIRNPSADPKVSLKPPLIALIVVAGLYVIGVFVVPNVVQSLLVKPNELEKEKPYLVHAIRGTREAYGLDRIELKQFPANDQLTMADLRRNQPTINNIKLWDPRPLRDTYKQLQVIRLYYDFPNISIDRYRVGGGYRQVMLSARELVHEQLQSQTWLNKHLIYTHGYGIALSPINQIDESGLPKLWVKDIPPEAQYPELRLDRPEIYYGLQTTSFALVDTTEQEFDYPRSKGTGGTDENVYTTYKGDGGVGIGTSFARLLFAIRFADYKLLFTSHLTDTSRVLFNRTIKQRVQSVAPFLMLDQEPYIAVVKGRLVWIQDAYTISYRYPYSKPTSLGRRKRINYIRNSVKVVVDAYNGAMRFFIWDEKDPMIATYRKIFPTLFSKKQDMSAALAEHVRYPKDLFAVQADMYESFHMTDPRVFYNQEDQWAMSRVLAARADREAGTGQRPTGLSAHSVTHRARMQPYYMIMRLPGEPREEFLLMVPYTPTNKDNMVAWLTARCDGDDYGKLLVYAFPKKKLIYGPMQVEARIDQDDYISQWITLRNQQGSKVYRGDLMVIPIEDSVLYVEPIYLEATQAQLPELKQVIVAFGKRLAMKSDLESALKAVFGVSDADVPEARASSAPTTQPAVGDGGDLARVALQQYRAAQAKLKAGDWAGYGEAQDKLRETLERLAKRLQGNLQPKSSGVPGSTTDKN